MPHPKRLSLLDSQLKQGRLRKHFVQGSGWDRDVRMQSFSWIGDQPEFGEPLAKSTWIPVPDAKLNVQQL
jgi:hypothetical protein